MEDCRELSECCRVTLRLPGLQGKCERQRMLPFLVFAPSLWERTRPHHNNTRFVGRVGEAATRHNRTS